jgi:hypothetical protein
LLKKGIVKYKGSIKSLYKSVTKKMTFLAIMMIKLRPGEAYKKKIYVLLSA